MSGNYPETLVEGEGDCSLGKYKKKHSLKARILAPICELYMRGRRIKSDVCSGATAGEAKMRQEQRGIEVNRSVEMGSLH